MIFVWLFLSIVCLGIVAALLQRFWLRKNGAVARDESEVGTPAEEECCGQHAICEKESLLAAVSREPVYYDDEELDAFKGRSSDAYTAEETAAFAEVLYTLHSEEVAGWMRSLQWRGVELPDSLKDEVLMIVGERRI